DRARARLFPRSPDDGIARRAARLGRRRDDQGGQPREAEGALRRAACLAGLDLHARRGRAEHPGAAPQCRHRQPFAERVLRPAGIAVRDVRGDEPRRPRACRFRNRPHDEPADAVRGTAAAPRSRRAALHAGGVRARPADRGAGDGGAAVAGLTRWTTAIAWALLAAALVATAAFAARWQSARRVNAMIDARTIET